MARRMAEYLLQEDGSFLTVEDGSGSMLLESGVLLQESGDKMLLEDGSGLILEMV